MEDASYIQLISSNYPAWLDEFKEVNDKRVLWDLIKYRIRQVSIKYSKQKARERTARLETAEQKIKQYDLLCNSDPSEKNMYDLDAAKYEYELLLDYIVRGNIVRSRIGWYEKGEKNSKYFLNLRLPHTSRFFVGRQKIFSCRLVCGGFRQVCDKIGACRAISDSARSQNVLSGLVG